MLYVGIKMVSQGWDNWYPNVVSMVYAVCWYKNGIPRLGQLVSGIPMLYPWYAVCLYNNGIPRLGQLVSQKAAMVKKIL
jgi:hypothetical protein